VNEALAEVKDKSGSQFCPRCVGALEAIVAGELDGEPALREPQLVD
jgi:HD-GYP domain-containing protein (c-di-GMP phosphodiesterase class II)